jgi:hypothetical protein
LTEDVLQPKISTVSYAGAEDSGGFPRARLASAKAILKSRSATSLTFSIEVSNTAGPGHSVAITALLLRANAVSNVSNSSAALCHAAKDGVTGMIFEMIFFDMIRLHLSQPRI